jgi:hypothetical protein
VTVFARITEVQDQVEMKKPIDQTKALKVPAGENGGTIHHGE